MWSKKWTLLYRYVLPEEATCSILVCSLVWGFCCCCRLLLFKQKRNYMLYQQFSKSGLMTSWRSLRSFQTVVHKAKTVFIIILRHYLLSSHSVDFCTDVTKSRHGWNCQGLLWKCCRQTVVDVLVSFTNTRSGWRNCHSPQERPSRLMGLHFIPGVPFLSRFCVTEETDAQTLQRQARVRLLHLQTELSFPPETLFLLEITTNR